MTGGFSLDNLVPQGDIDTLRMLDNKTHEDGFEQSGGGESTVDLGFSNLSDLSQYADLGQQGVDPNAAFGFPNSLQNQQQQSAVPQENWEAAVVGAAGKGLKAVLALLIEVCKSVGTRTADDWGFFGNRAVLAGAIFSVIGIMMLIMAGLTSAAGFGFMGLGGACLFAGIFVGGTGSILMGVAYNSAQKKPQTPEDALSAIVEDPDPVVEAYINNIEDSIENIVSEELIEELNDILDDVGCGEGHPSPPAVFEEAMAVMPDFDALDRQINAQKRAITRDSLINSFLPYFVQKTSQFRESLDIHPGTPDYERLRATCVKAIANLQNTSIDKVTERLLSARETFFSYKLVFERVKKIKNPKELERELETYFRATVYDPELSEEDIRKQRLRIKATVEASADTWEITINKGTSGIITIGDCLAGQRELDFFKKEKNALPIIAGITESGSVILEDAQYLDNIMVTGKQRSGKSWYVNSILTSLVAFNSPEEVALIVIDPKNSTMFNTLALFPHVIGLHDGTTINEIFREIIDIEAVRRAERLRESRCENIKDYNAEHPAAKMPRLYIVIDEVITVRDGFAARRRENR